MTVGRARCRLFYACCAAGPSRMDSLYAPRARAGRRLPAIHNTHTRCAQGAWVCLLYTYAVLGMEIFGGKFSGNPRYAVVR